MAQSFTSASTRPLSELNTDAVRRVLVTGAAGNVGSYFAENSHGKYDLRLMVRPDDDIAKIKDFGEIVYADLTDCDALVRACEGVDTIVHLAADPSPEAGWESLLPNNIVGTYNLFTAAKEQGCRRVIYASSIHAVSGYPADYQVHTSDPVNPGDLYGVTKCFGEALARYMAEKEGVSAIVVRIGAFQPIENAREASGLGMLDIFVSERDLNQLFHRCIDTQEVRFAIVHGVSDNRFKRLDISDTRELLGYAPTDDLTALNSQTKDLHLGDRVGSHSVTDESQESPLKDVGPDDDDARPGEAGEAKGKEGRVGEERAPA